MSATLNMIIKPISAMFVKSCLYLPLFIARENLALPGKGSTMDEIRARILIFLSISASY
jgi:hypothetical protein